MSTEQLVKRMRVFAGPNGSGKSTIIKELQQIVRTGVYINADDIEKSGRDKGFINLGDFGVESTLEHFNTYMQSSTLVQKAQQESKIIDLVFSDNIIRMSKQVHSYEAAFISDYLRTLLLTANTTFSFETVLSHVSKIDTFQRSAETGYRNYLYYISTESPEINVQRVSERVSKGGHPVDPDKIRGRYYRSMELLHWMIPYCHRCFIYDNSLETGHRLIAEIEDNSRVIIHTNDSIPLWVDTYVFDKLGVYHDPYN